LLNNLRWILIVFLGLLLGAASVQYMVAHPMRMSAYLALSLITLFVLLVALARYFRSKQRLAAIALSLVTVVAGWYVMTDVVLSRDTDRPMPELVRQPGDAGNGHAAVIYLTHGEPPVYDPISWVNQMNEFDEQGIPFAPFMTRPFFFKSLRDHYLQVGKSEHREKHIAMLAGLEQAYRDAGDTTTRFYLSFLDDNPRVGAAFINALNDGASRIIVAEVFVTISSHTAEGEHQLMEMNPEKYGVEVKFVGPMWDSEPMYQMFVNRANAQRGDIDKAKIGVLLVAHGQPDEWDDLWPLQTEQEGLFGDHILDRFAADGYARKNLSKAWMSFKEPKPAVIAEQLYAEGIEQLFFFSYTISAAGMHSQYDIPALVAEADLPDEFPVINLGAWGNDPLAIQAIKEKIDPALFPAVLHGSNPDN
jgi:sirohydrochlorin ferrochelatase